jgi:NAD(P)H dehydrogenase (quinone)
MKMLILYYSAYGHIHRMAEAAAEGARSVPGSEVTLKRVPETLPKELADKIGVTRAQAAFSHVPIASIDELADYDSVIFGVPTRFGNMCGQMRVFLDAAGPLWAGNRLVGKVGSAFTSTATQHGGQETTLITTYITLLHLGFVVVGLPYSFAGQNRLDEITGGSPYGAAAIAGPQGQRPPSANELDGARFQGRHVAAIASQLFSG